MRSTIKASISARAPDVNVLAPGVDPSLLDKQCGYPALADCSESGLADRSTHGYHHALGLPEQSSILTATATRDMIGSMVKNQHAVALGRLGGLRGGPARARSMTPEKRTEVARRAANARWPLEDRLVRVGEDRLYRRHLARTIAGRTGLDEGDIEHALFNLTLSPMERLSRGLACRS